jgi:hypothetical protein
MPRFREGQLVMVNVPDRPAGPNRGAPWKGRFLHHSGTCGKYTDGGWVKERVVTVQAIENDHFYTVPLTCVYDAEPAEMIDLGAAKTTGMVQ